MVLAGPAAPKQSLVVHGCSPKINNRKKNYTNALKHDPKHMKKTSNTPP